MMLKGGKSIMKSKQKKRSKIILKIKSPPNLRSATKEELDEIELQAEDSRVEVTRGA